MNHYDTLGVVKGASQDAIKRAYRRKAKTAHPDRSGGNVQDMTRINAAWRTLGNPQRRLRYDQTGNDGPEVSVDAQVRDCLLGVFLPLIQKVDDVDYVAEARKQIRAKRSQDSQARAKLLGAIRLLEKRRKKVRTKTGANLFQQLIDNELHKLHGAVAQADVSIATQDAALKVLEDYESDAVEEILAVTVTQWFSIGTASD